jgi:hypothetical protein
VPIKTTLKEPNIDYRLVDERGPTAERLLKTRESPINLAHSKGQITRFQYAAAQKFYLHWFKGGLCESYGNIDLTRVLGNSGEFSGMAKTYLQASHRKILRRALELLMAEKSKILQDVILAEKSLVEVGYSIGYKDRDWSRAHVLRLLRQGLDLLCHEWGID